MTPAQRLRAARRLARLRGLGNGDGFDLVGAGLRAGAPAVAAALLGRVQRLVGAGRFALRVRTPVVEEDDAVAERVGLGEVELDGGI
jgi:hypothetical protein